VSTEQEYDAQTEMVEDQEPAESGPGPYPEPIPHPPPRHVNQQQIHPQPPQQNSAQPSHPGQAQAMNLGAGGQQYGSMTTQLLDPYDPMLDMDPFGLSASMQFPSSFSFDTSSMR